MGQVKSKVSTQRKTTQEQKNNQRPNKITREFMEASIRSMEGEGNERKFILSFSSEEPYGRFWGTEILDHSEGSVDLERLNEVGCVLFNHKRDVVIAKINRAWIEDGRGCAEIEFDKDEEAEKIYQKVKSGTLKGVSVGYMVDAWEEVVANKKSSDGRFDGPASIATKWWPYEISIVSVPADPTVGVGRDLENENVQRANSYDLGIYEKQLQINKNLSL